MAGTEKNKHIFPDPRQMGEEDIALVGGGLSSDLLLNAYQIGLFPWYNPGEPVMWWCPRERMILHPREIHISHSMRNVINSNVFRITADRDFEEIMVACAHIPRSGQEGTWITDEIIDNYLKLHKLGYAHSIEVRDHTDEIVGGLYGVSMGRAFFGESMFSLQPNASKFAFIRLCQRLEELNFSLVDCQVYTPHLESLGANPVARNHFLNELENALTHPTIKGNWGMLFG